MKPKDYLANDAVESAKTEQSKCQYPVTGGVGGRPNLPMPENWQIAARREMDRTRFQ